MTIEELLQSGKSKDEVMQAFEAAYDAVAKANEPEGKAEPKPDPKSEGNEKPDDYLVKLTETLDKFNSRLDEIEKKFSDQGNMEGNQEQKTEPEGRKLTDEQVNEALQKLNLLSINDKIDVNQQIEDNFVEHFGSLIGVDTKGEEKK